MTFTLKCNSLTVFMLRRYFFVNGTNGIKKSRFHCNFGFKKSFREIRSVRSVSSFLRSKYMKPKDLQNGTIAKRSFRDRSVIVPLVFGVVFTDFRNMDMKGIYAMNK